MAVLAFSQTTEPNDTRIVNLSTRARVSAENPLITGFAIQGTEPRTVLVRVAGPTLGAFGVTGVLTQPRLRLHDAKGNVVMENAGWADSAVLSEAFLQAGAFPFARGSADAALIATIAPGVYTMVALDASEQNPGVALLEVYDLDNANKDSRLVNVSTRTTVGVEPGEEVISGFILAGSSSRKFLMRGVGPGLAPYGVADSLVNPMLALYDAAGKQVADNDNWNAPEGTVASGTIQAVATAAAATVSTTGSIPVPPIIAVAVDAPPALVAPRSEIEKAAIASGAFALAPGSYDSAFLVTLTPGAYTLQIKSAGTFEVQQGSIVNGVFVPTGSNSGSSAAIALVTKPAKPGVGLLEIYEIP
jgi:hypothetical protein